MTQNLNFKLLKWQEAISKVKKTGWNMTPDSKASYRKVIWSAVTFRGKNTVILSMESSTSCSYMQMLYTHALLISPPLASLKHLSSFGVNHPLEGPISLHRWHQKLGQSFIWLLRLQVRITPGEISTSNIHYMSRRFRNSFDANSPIIICISWFPSDLFFHCGWN